MSVVSFRMLSDSLGMILPVQPNVLIPAFQFRAQGGSDQGLNLSSIAANFSHPFHLNNATSLAGYVMPNSDSEELRAELLSLLDKQFEVLELSTCVTLTDEEKREYEARKQRIHELFKQLGTVRAAA
jgi:hypothetical protein